MLSANSVSKIVLNEFTGVIEHAGDADDKELEARRAELQVALDEINRSGEEWRLGKSRVVTRK